MRECSASERIDRGAGVVSGSLVLRVSVHRDHPFRHHNPPFRDIVITGSREGPKAWLSGCGHSRRESGSSSDRALMVEE